MHITVRFFAVQRAQTGLRTYDLELPDGSLVSTAWDALVARMPQLEPAATSVRFARNSAYVDTSEPLADGDELAIIPPVAGGAEPGPRADRRAAQPRGAGSFRRIEVLERPLDEALVGELRADVASDADGAVVVFVGQTRESPGTPAPGQEAEAVRFAGQRVAGLSYEAFEPMALAVLDTIADEIEERFGVRRLAIIHRVGEVSVGESSVIIAVASPHRAEAFEACRYAIEELKGRAPIWKAERFADGSVWMGSPARHGPEEVT